jgi:hypothetical protein
MILIRYYFVLSCYFMHGFDRLYHLKRMNDYIRHQIYDVIGLSFLNFSEILKLASCEHIVEVFRLEQEVVQVIVIFLR